MKMETNACTYNKIKLASALWLSIHRNSYVYADIVLTWLTLAQGYVHRALGEKQMLYSLFIQLLCYELDAAQS